jgi:hypothetical protein
MRYFGTSAFHNDRFTLVYSCVRLVGRTAEKFSYKISFNVYNIKYKILDYLPLKMRPKGCPETSVINYHYYLCNSPEERSSHKIVNLRIKKV